MRRSRWMLSAVTALLVVAGALAAAAQNPSGTSGKGGYGKPSKGAAVTIKAGDDGWVTASTTWDLAQYPVAKAFGVKAAGHTRVVLKGKPLSSELGAIDTIIQRPKDFETGKGGGPLEIAALSLESEKPVKIGDKSYSVRVGLSDTAKIVKPGHITATLKGKDGGTFSSSFSVYPKLVFTPEGGGQAVTIDCGAVPCGKGGKGFVLATTAAPFVISGGPGKFEAAAIRLTTVKAGTRVGGEGSPAYTTTGSSNFFPGVQATGPQTFAAAARAIHVGPHPVRSPVAAQVQ